MRDRRPFRARFSEFDVPRIEESVRVTPEDAACILERNTSNRTANKGKVQEYAAAMTAGKWKSANDLIVLSKAGRLINGQHRLMACILANVPVLFDFKFGADEDVYNIMDRGRRRTLADDLDVLGYANTRDLAAAAILVWLDDQGKLELVNLRRWGGFDVEAVLAAHPGLPDSVRWATASKIKKMMQPRIASFCHYRLTSLDSEAAEAFFVDLVDGTNLERGDAVYLLRERLLANRGSKYPLLAREVLALTIKAWNHRRADNYKVRHLRWTSDGNAPEAFPKPR